MKLTIELVPKTCFYTNVRSNVPKTTWDVLRKTCYAKANHVCEICGGKGQKHPVECHEVWKYDEYNGVQQLLRLIALCPACHTVKHIGMANIRGQGEHAIRHLASINGISYEEALAYKTEAFAVWRDRSLREWTLDISIIDRLLKEAQS
jgi:cytochrome c2